MNALQVETDPQNTHMLLGGLLLTVQDAVTFEETDANSDPFHASPPPANDSNLLSSGLCWCFGDKKDLICSILNSFRTMLQCSFIYIILISSLSYFSHQNLSNEYESKILGHP